MSSNKHHQHQFLPGTEYEGRVLGKMLFSAVPRSIAGSRNPFSCNLGASYDLEQKHLTSLSNSPPESRDNTATCKTTRYSLSVVSLSNSLETLYRSHLSRLNSRGGPQFWMVHLPFVFKFLIFTDFPTYKVFIFLNVKSWVQGNFKLKWYSTYPGSMQEP